MLPNYFMNRTRFLSLVSAFSLASMNLQAQQVYVGSPHIFAGIPEGYYPGSIVMGVDNAIYGVTWRGGDTNLVHDGGYAGRLDGGTIFKINIDGSGYKVLHTFSDSE